MLTLLMIPSIAVKISCLYKCTQKSASSSWARFRRIPQPAFRVSRLESVRVCSNKIRTICSRSSSFRHFVSSIIFVIAFAAAERFFKSALWRSARTGKMLFSRMAASSGSAGGLIGFEVGSARFLTLTLGFDFPILPSSLYMNVECCWYMVIALAAVLKTFFEESQVGDSPPSLQSNPAPPHHNINTRLCTSAYPTTSLFCAPVSYKQYNT